MLPADAQQTFNRLVEEYPESPFTGDARKEIETHKLLAAKTQQRMVRLQFEIVAAEVQAASGKPADLEGAMASLNAVKREAEQSGIRSLLYEANLASAKAEMKYGNKLEGQTRLADLEKSAMFKRAPCVRN